MEYTVLVTGGAGFIGSHVVDELVGLGCKVIVLDDLSGGFRENINGNATFIKGSINDHGLVNRIFHEYHFDYVFHLAAYAAEGLSHFIKKFNYENNLVGSINLINASVNGNSKCFVFTSSIAVYGENQLPMNEDLVPMPGDSYGIAKLSVEYELKICKEMFGLNYIIFRPHNVFGERQNIGDKYRNVIGIFMNQIMQGNPLTVFGDGEQTRAFSYIKDVSPIIAKSVLVKEAHNETFNIGAEEVYTVNELLREVCKAMGVEVRVEYLEGRNEVRHAFCSHSKIKEILGYETKYSLNEGLKNMSEWAWRIGGRRSKKFENIEIFKNIPKSWLEQSED